MRIGVTCYPSYGGSGVLATELAKKLAERGHDIHFITYEMPVRLAGYMPGISYHEVNVPSYPLFKYPPYLLALTNKMVEVARFCSLDVLHAHYAIPHATSAVLAREVFGNGGPRVVTTLHGTDISLLASDPSFYDVLTWSLSSSDGVTAVSNALAAQTKAQMPLDGQIEVIHNFVDTSVYHRRPCRHLAERYCHSGAVIGHVSNFRAVKRPADVVTAFAGISKRVRAHLVLVGEGPELGRVRELAMELGVFDRVSFLGHQDQIAEILSCMDLFILPSEQESFGLAALEAMACGTPVLAYEVGGLPEVIEAGRGGFLLPFGDIGGLVEQGVALLSDKQAWRKVSEAGVARVEELFAAEIIVPQYEAYYERVLARAAARGER